MCSSDLWAHRGVRGAVERNRVEPTAIGVVGSGLNVIYPPEHDEMWGWVGTEGLLLSEHAPGVAPQKFHFPMRNRIIAALAGSNVPVAPALGFCNDESVNELPFYVMRFVDGLVVRDKAFAEDVLTPAARTHASESIVDTMVAIHGVDINAVGLADLGKHEGYIARQLKRWHQNIVDQRTRDLPLVESVYEELSRRIPEQKEVTLVHGDYRLDNCMVNASGDVIAVLDWEICTLGDPMADLGLLMVYWNGPNDDASAWSNSVCTADGFLDRPQLAARYAEKSGRDISHLDFYTAFAFWKLACIIEGVYARYLGGALGQKDPAELEPFRIQVEGAAQKAAAALERLR